VVVNNEKTFRSLDVVLVHILDENFGVGLKYYEFWNSG
jgi:hypothetical protein|tara:strand:+ start:419 stop:532 length:114 start_codon:yes stop_codon:yes gene_type:complete